MVTGIEQALMLAAPQQPCLPPLRDLIYFDHRTYMLAAEPDFIGVVGDEEQFVCADEFLSFKVLN